ncbi:MAG TPA: ATP synthase F1 subunit delta [Terracidiphilus sp.]|jgi:F-type H+-transporting ATPase subunit delta|nr:ATP synthase F1 subunit delta [Terracidiphilus sp.]
MPAFVSHYARALADVALQARLDTAAIDRQLTDFIAAWDSSAPLREVVENPAIPETQKIAILDKINVKLGMAQQLRNFIAILIRNDRIAHVHEVADAYRAELQERQGIRRAEIVTARELSEPERNVLLDGVGKLAGAKIQATFKLDPALLGGTVVRIGSTVYDGSVKGRLERLREELIAG